MFNAGLTPGTMQRFGSGSSRGPTEAEMQRQNSAPAMTSARCLRDNPLLSGIFICRLVMYVRYQKDAHVFNQIDLRLSFLE